MHVSEALERLDDIHDQLTKTEVYRGFRVPSVALTGVVGLVAAALRPDSAAGDPLAFVTFWAAVACGCGVLSFGAALYAFAFQEDEFDRRRTRRVLLQFVPGLAAGAVLTIAFARGGPPLIALLPGVWATVFGLTIVAARPYLPRAVGWVGLFYLAAGAWLLMRPESAADLGGWAVGGVFGVGHLASAAALHTKREGDADA